MRSLPFKLIHKHLERSASTHFGRKQPSKIFSKRSRKSCVKPEAECKRNYSTDTEGGRAKLVYIYISLRKREGQGKAPGCDKVTYPRRTGGKHGPRDPKRFGREEK